MFLLQLLLLRNEVIVLLTLTVEWLKGDKVV